jgi:mannosylglycoprotein endo-beta-mannosidase
MLAFADAFFHGVADLERINRSYMVLLPKKQDAVDVDAFRPICLQNCALKIITKALTARLQAEIPKLINIHQTGFVKGRSISDTFVYAVELVQTCHKRKRPAIVLKLDFAKAFDTVNWAGLTAVLQARGFDRRWIGWIQCLLSSSKSAVLVNGCPGPWINCKRGLQQGDPLSPYLFILVAETLQRMITNAVEIRHPTDANLPCAVLQYADDTLIVFKAETATTFKLKEILDLFAAMSGLHINFNKSTLVPIFANVQVVQQCVQILGCSEGAFPSST